ncbi:MAG: hypothetical protein V3R57_07760 [Candidatus Bathyarchaeia archaeon]
MKTTEEKLALARTALYEISLGKGPYKIDPFEHAESVIADMKKTAADALKETE